MALNSKNPAEVAHDGNTSTDSVARDSKLAHQYGGNNKSGWLTHLPDSWLPYVQLARLSPPVGLLLVYFPHIFGILHAAIRKQSPPLAVLQTSAMILGGSFFLSNALHIWNDLIDAPLDALVERTRNRPIPRGAVSPISALVFTATQVIGAAAFLPYLQPGGNDVLQSALYALPSIVGWAYYPWAKRHTNFPQLVLGFCKAWGIVMGSLAVGVEPFTIPGWLGFPSVSGEAKPTVDQGTLCLFLACAVWAVIYDTVYAHQDVKEDMKVGIKSLAVLYRDHTKSLLWQLLAMMTAMLIGCGTFSGLSVVYYLVAVGGVLTSLGLMIAMVDLKSSESCWWWFGNGFWFAGGAIASGLLLEYLYQGMIQAGKLTQTFT